MSTAYPEYRKRQGQKIQNPSSYDANNYYLNENPALTKSLNNKSRF